MVVELGWVGNKGNPGSIFFFTARGYIRAYVSMRKGLRNPRIQLKYMVSTEYIAENYYYYYYSLFSRTQLQKRKKTLQNLFFQSNEHL